MPTPAPPSVALLHPHFGDGSSPLLLTQSHHAKHVVMEAADLRHAGAVRQRLDLKTDACADGEESAVVLMALTVHLARDVRTAVREIAESGVKINDSVHYVGTAAGLAGLIADVAGTGLADGVGLRIAIAESARVLRHIIDDVLPRLRNVSVVADSTAVDTVLERIERAPVSLSFSSR